MITITIKPLVGAEQGVSIPFEVSVASPKLADTSGAKDLQVSGTVSKLDAGYVVAGTVAVTIPSECARCLQPFDQRLTLVCSEQFSAHPGDEQFPAGKDRLELDPMLRAVILTGLPERPLHDPDCKGLCPVCGKDRNREPHTHPQAPAEPGPFDQLKKLR
jgi:DUF177 domain-containing protein